MIIYDINHVLLVFGLGVILSNILWVITIHYGKSCKPPSTKGTHCTMLLDTSHMGYFFLKRRDAWFSSYLVSGFLPKLQVDYAYLSLL
jgi:hypothetical protein